ncbi:MAG: hypothetical protein AABX13_05450 [Nanoarchaeota archaeon]
MDDLIFRVKKQKDGWYLASPVHEKLGGATEAPDYDTLKERIQEFVRLGLRDDFHKEANLPRQPQIRLLYTELLYANHHAERILIAGNPDGDGGYRIRSDTPLSLNLHHKNFDTLRALLQKELQRQGHHDKHIEFHLEEVITPTEDYHARKIA